MRDFLYLIFVIKGLDITKTHSIMGCYRKKKTFQSKFVGAIFMEFVQNPKKSIKTLIIV